MRTQWADAGRKSITWLSAKRWQLGLKTCLRRRLEGTIAIMLGLIVPWPAMAVGGGPNITEGTLTCSDGTPLANCPVTITFYDSSGQVASVFSTTNANGYFNVVLLCSSSNNISEYFIVSTPCCSHTWTIPSTCCCGNLGTLVCNTCDCNTNGIDLNSGIDHASGNLYPTSTLSNPVFDPYWTVLLDPDPNTAEPRPANVIQRHPFWALPDPNSQWIGPFATWSAPLNGHYIFQTCFCLGQSFSNVQVRVGAKADDDAFSASLLPAGVTITPSTWGDPFGASTITTFSPWYNVQSDFQPGENCIRVLVNNTGYVAMGLDLLGQVTATAGLLDQTPECCTTNGWIVGCKWDDQDGDCVRDLGEPTLPGWTICAGSYCATTDGTGYYYLQVPQGSYTVTEVLQTGWAQTCPTSGSYTVAVQPGQVYPSNDFGNQQDPACEPLTDGSACADYECPPDALGPRYCQPKCVIFGAGPPMISECACLGFEACHAVIPQPPGPDPFCAGFCPPGMTCHETISIDGLPPGAYRLCCNCEPDGVGGDPTGAVLRKACDLPIALAGKTSDPRQGGVTEIVVDYENLPGDGEPTIEQAVCATGGSFEPYSGAAAISCTPVPPNKLDCTFTPGLENGRTYRLAFGADVGNPTTIIVRSLLGDANSDGLVNATDRSSVVGSWTGGGYTCSTDANNDGQTNATDRSLVVGAWTGPQNCAP